MILDEARRLVLKAAFGEGEEAVAAYRSWRKDVTFHDIDSSAFRVLGELARVASRPDVNDPEIARIRGALKHTWIHNMQRTRALAVALIAIDQKAIDALVINGAALTLRFPSLTKTHVVDDFEILVRERDWISAAELLASASFRLPVELPSEPSWLRKFRKIRTYSVLDGVTCSGVDLVCWPEPGWTHEEFIDELVARGESRRVAGQKVIIPELADHLYLTLANFNVGEQDKVFSQVVEVKRLVRESGGVIDWCRILNLCHRFRPNDVAQTVLSLVADDVGVSVPTSVLEQLRLC